MSSNARAPRSRETVAATASGQGRRRKRSPAEVRGTRFVAKLAQLALWAAYHPDPWCPQAQRSPQNWVL